MQIIGFSGYAGSGKDTAGEALKSLGWLKRSFADPLKESCSLVTGVDIKYFTDPLLKNQVHPNLYGKTPREVLQLMGTEGWRTLIHPNIWVNSFIQYALKCSHDMPTIPKGIYTSDVRFINEADAILKAGGILIHIQRSQNASPEFAHASELGMQAVSEKAQVIITNDGTIEDLHSKILGYLSQTIPR